MRAGGCLSLLGLSAASLCRASRDSVESRAFIPCPPYTQLPASGWDLVRANQIVTLMKAKFTVFADFRTCVWRDALLLGFYDTHCVARPEQRSLSFSLVP